MFLLFSEKKMQFFEELLPEFIEYIKELKGMKKNQAKTVVFVYLFHIINPKK